MPPTSRGIGEAWVVDLLTLRDFPVFDRDTLEGDEVWGCTCVPHVAVSNLQQWQNWQIWRFWEERIQCLSLPIAWICKTEGHFFILHIYWGCCSKTASITYWLRYSYGLTTFKPFHTKGSKGLLQQLKHTESKRQRHRQITVQLVLILQLKSASHSTMSVLVCQNCEDWFVSLFHWAIPLINYTIKEWVLEYP